MNKFRNKMYQGIIVGVSWLLVVLNFQWVSAIEDENRTPSGLPIDQLEEVINQVVEDNLDLENVGVSVAVVYQGEIVFIQGYGYADREKGVLVNEETIFEIGSITKTMTWVSLLQLQERGKVNLGNSIEEYIGEGKINLDKGVPTVMDLMNHTAGFEESYQRLFVFAKDYDPTKSLDYYLYHQGASPNQFVEPGKITAYSNYGAGVAGDIIEKVTGQSYYEYLYENILAPQEMEKTIVYDLSFEGNTEIEISKGYGGIIGEKMAIPLVSAGGISSTAKDMGNYMIAFMNGDLFESEDALNLFQEKTYSSHEDGNGWAYGFTFTNYGENFTLSHSGGTDGFSSYMSMMPNEEFGYIILINQNSGVLIDTPLYPQLETELMGKTDTEVSEVSLQQEESKEISGSYQLARRVYHSKDKLLGTIFSAGTQIQVEKKEKEIAITLFNGQRSVYTEIENGIYQRDENLLPFDNQALMTDYLTVREVDGEIVLGLSNVEFTKISFVDTMNYVILSVGPLLLLSVVNLLYLMVKRIRKKNKVEFDQVIFRSSLLSLLTIIYIVVFQGVIALFGGTWFLSLIGYILMAILGGVSMIGIVKSINWKKERYYYYVYNGFLLVFFIFLWNYNFIF